MLLKCKLLHFGQLMDATQLRGATRLKWNRMALGTRMLLSMNKANTKFS